MNSYVLSDDLYIQGANCPLTVRYTFLNEMILFYESPKDTFLKASAYHNLATVLFEAGDLDAATNALDSAICLFNTPRSQDICFKIRFNKLSIDFAMGRRKSTLQELKKILMEKERLKDARFASNVFSLAFRISGNLDYLYEGLAYDTVSAKIPTRLAFHYLNSNPDSVVKYADMSFDRLKYRHPLGQEVNALYLKYKASLFRGKSESALYFVDRYISTYDSLQGLKDSEKLLKFQNEREFKDMLITQKHKRTVSSLLWITAVVVLVILFSISFVLWKLKLKDMQLKNVNRNLELERLRHREAFGAICSIKNNTASEAIYAEIDKMSESNAFGDDIAEDLKKKLKIHLSSDSEWDIIASSIEQVQPEFQNYLRTRYPDITETNIRTAIYTLMGISGKRFANILGIEYNSVKKRRYNLRKVLGLQSGESLEKKLVELNEESKKLVYS